jgi:hypothetical protein
MSRCQRFGYVSDDGRPVTGFICFRGGPPPLPRADCGGCGRDIGLRGGRFIPHGPGCPGAGRTPEEAAALGRLTPPLFGDPS